MAKFNVNDITKALEYMKSKVNTMTVELSFDDRDRLIMKATDISANQVIITIFATEAAKMPEVAETRRL